MHIVLLKVHRSAHL